MTQVKVSFGIRKAIQEISLEHGDDGTSKLGVTVWVPTGGEPAYRAIVAVIDITADERAEMIRALTVESLPVSDAKPAT